MKPMMNMMKVVQDGDIELLFREPELKI